MKTNMNTEKNRRRTAFLRRMTAILLAAVIAVGMLGACSSGKNSSARQSSSYDTAYAPAAASDSKDYSAGGGYYADEAMAEAMPEAAWDEEDADWNSSAETTASGVTTDAPEITGEKLVYTGNLSIQTLDYDTTMSSLRAQIAAFSGVIQYENSGMNSSYWYRTEEDDSFKDRYTNLTVRIPSERFYAFMDAVNEVGVVISSDVNVDNITREYYDTTATIEALKKEEARLLEMMDLAETVEDMITVEARLSEVEMRLNSRQNSLSLMDTDVKYSTITMYIREVARVTESNPSFLTRLGNAVADSADTFISFLQGLVIALIFMLPFLIIIALIIILIVVLVRRSRRKKQAAMYPGGVMPANTKKARRGRGRNAAPMQPYPAPQDAQGNVWTGQPMPQSGTPQQPVMPQGGTPQQPVMPQGGTPQQPAPQEAGPQEKA